MASVSYDAQHSPADKDDFDLEKSKDIATGNVEEVQAPDDGVKRTNVLWRLAKKLDKYGVETRGIERIPPTERKDVTALNCFTIWAAANFTVSTFALGMLGNSIWYMGFRDATLTIVFFNLLGALPAATCSVWGARTGMRQLALSRFGFGYWAVLLPTLLNCLACIGWSCINAISGGLVLHSVAYNSSLKAIPVQGAIAVIAAATLVVSFLGYRVVHLYEKYSSILPVIVFIIYAVQVGRFATPGDWGGSGESEASSVLSFGAAIFGFSIGWVSLAGHYSCGLPEDTSGVKIFTFTYLGIIIPCIGLETLGAAAMTMFVKRPDFAAAYESTHLGGLLAAPLVGAYGGFGRFCLIVLALSIIANNIPNIYSFSLTFQVLGRWAQAIPRPFLALTATGIYTALAIAGASNFESALDNLLLLLGYWLAVYVAILFIEHYVFRGGKWSNWNFDSITVPSELPKGIAAMIAMLVGMGGAVLGMSTVFWVGPIAKLVGNPMFGTDFGFILSGSFAAVTYLPLRYLEKKRFGV